MKSVDESLKRLGLDYIDLIQVHDVEFCQSLEQLVKYTIPALLELKRMGKVRWPTCWVMMPSAIVLRN